MGMVVRTNTMAMNAYRQLGVNNTAVGKSLEKLSSGFRINRAADDASGLAISEKMKAQIKGLEQASANSQDGISLIQTAEGATTEIHNMLNRMVELATKSANGTIQDDVDRDAIQQEVNDLNAEITRIAQSTNFNGINLLDGSLGGGAPIVKATGTGEVYSGKGTAATAMNGKSAALVDETNAGVTFKKADGTTKDLKLTITAGDEEDLAAKLNADADFAAMYEAKKDATTKAVVITAKTPGAASAMADVKFTFDKTGAATAGTTAITGGANGNNAKTEITFGKAMIAGDTISIGGKTYTMGAALDAKKGTFTNFADLKTLAEADGKYTLAGGIGAAGTLTVTANKSGQGLKLQVGDTNAEYNHVTVSVDDLSAEGLDLKGLDVSNQDAAGDSIDTIKAAINKVSTNRANLGSLQNRLEYTINNLDTTAENMTAANSRIRDTDMAKEMMNYTKMNILTQSAQAMLAQANQQPQAILQLLQ